MSQAILTKIPFGQVLHKEREEDDSDVDDTVSECSLAVNVSSPGANRSLRPTPEKSCLNESAIVAPQWQQRRTPRKVKVQEEQSQEYEAYEDNDDYDYYGEDDADVHPEFDELCNAISNISMNEDVKVGLPAFEGRHVRFNYNSDDELESEVVDASTPQGKTQFTAQSCFHVISWGAHLLCLLRGLHLLVVPRAWICISDSYRL